jgi:hypothetical protein
MADLDYDLWYAEVSRIVEDLTGLSADDLADWDYWDSWEAGTTAATAAREALLNSGWDG